MVSSILEVLESSFILSTDETKVTLKHTAVEVASNLLTLPTPPSVQVHTTALLAALHNSKSNYHSHKVEYLKLMLYISLLYILFLFYSLGSSLINSCS
jgi:E3 ubiquitin-protein ligase UBR4